MAPDEMRYEELAAAPAAPNGGGDLGRLQNVPVELAVEIGRTRMTIGEALALAPGSIVTVGRLAGEPVDLLVNGRAIARGEVVAVDEQLGLRITEIAGPVVEVDGAAAARGAEAVEAEEAEVVSAADVAPPAQPAAPPEPPG